MQTIAVTTSRTANAAAYVTALAKTTPGKLLLGLSATVFIAAAAHVAIPLPFTPVPLTLQPLAVLAVGLAFGPYAGLLVMLAYLAEGTVGLPVFSPTGPGGTAQLFGATGGFLMAYPVVAFIAGAAGRVATRMPRFLAAFLCCNAAMVFLFVCGAGWLMQFAHLNLHQTWIAGVAPFLPGEIVKVFIAAGSYSALYRSNRIV